MTYCPTCDESRWQLTGLPVQRATTCSACGTELRPERRLPGRAKPTETLEERRGALQDRSSGAATA